MYESLVPTRIPSYQTLVTFERSISKTMRFPTILSGMLNVFYLYHVLVRPTLEGSLSNFHLPERSITSISSSAVLFSCTTADFAVNIEHAAKIRDKINDFFLIIFDI